MFGLSNITMGVMGAAALFAGLQTLRLNNAKGDLEQSRADLAVQTANVETLAEANDKLLEQVKLGEQAQNTIEKLQEELQKKAKVETVEIIKRIPVPVDGSCPVAPDFIVRDINARLNRTAGQMPNTDSVGEGLPVGNSPD